MMLSKVTSSPSHISCFTSCAGHFLYQHPQWMSSHNAVLSIVIGCLDNTGVYSQPGQGHSSAPISCSFRLCSVQAVSCIGAAHESYIVPMVTGNDCIRTQGSCVTHEVRHLGMSTRLITSPPPPPVPV